MARSRTIAILYHARGTYPLRSAVETHLFAWKRHSQHRTAYVNAAFNDPARILADLKPDAIIVHTSFCSLRWNDAEYLRLAPAIAAISDMNAVKIAIPQDEYYFTARLREMVTAMGIDVVLSCADQDNWRPLYGDLTDSVAFKTVLTGYLDDDVVRRARSWSKPLAERAIFLSYRAWDTGFWLGEHGTHKVRVGETMRTALEHRNIASDISMVAADTIAGPDWLRFLANSRATIGVEGGSSLIDLHGTIKTCVDDHVRDNPDATLADVQEHCFPTDHGNFKLACLSPRHFEAIATRTVQALVRGSYSGILEADRHYIPIEPDYSNLDNVIDQLKDDGGVQEMVDRAYTDIVESGRFTYRSFVAQIDRDFVETCPETALPFSTYKHILAALHDWWNWRIIQAECIYLKHPGLFRPFAWLLKPIYGRFVPN